MLNIFHGLYFISYFIGIPGLLTSHAIAGFLGLNGRFTYAYRLSLISLLTFLALITTVNLMLN